MKINIIDSGSSGNCCIITNGNNRKLMIDCGIKASKIVSDANFGSFKDYDYLLITHEHTDHIRGKSYFTKLLPTISPQNVKEETYETMNWLILPFKVQHDVDCYGYLIKDRISHKTILWATDFCNMPLIENCKVDVACIECNHDKETIERRLADGEEMTSKYYNHNSLENLLDYLPQLDAMPPKVVLLHESGSNLNKEKAIREVEKLGTTVILAKKNTEIEI